MESPQRKKVRLTHVLHRDSFMKRREFLAISSAAVASPVIISAADEAKKSASTATVREPARDLPIKGCYDVVVSVGFLPHSSYRVTRNAVAMGEAAGKTAAVAAAKGVVPGKVAIKDIKG